VEGGVLGFVVVGSLAVAAATRARWAIRAFRARCGQSRGAWRAWRSLSLIRHAVAVVVGSKNEELFSKSDSRASGGIVT